MPIILYLSFKVKNSMRRNFKFFTILSLFGCLFLLTACPPIRTKSKLDALKKNNMDFPDLRKTYYEGIEFWLSDLFEMDYDDSYVLTDVAMTRIIYEIDLNFSVDYFDRNAAENIKYRFDENITALDAVHDYYILKREESLFEPITTIKKELPKSVEFPGYIQVVHGSNSSYDNPSSYFTATIQVDKDFYVFQLIGKKENMGYLYDDFLDILKSIQK